MGKIVESKSFVSFSVLYALYKDRRFVDMPVGFCQNVCFLDCSHYSDQSNTTFLFIRIVQSSLPRLFGRTKKPVCLPQTGSYVLFMFTSPHVLPFDVRFALRRPRVLPHTGCTVCKTRNLRSAAPSMLRSNSALHCTQSNPFFLHSFRSHPSFQIPTRVCEPFYGVHSGSRERFIQTRCSSEGTAQVCHQFPTRFQPNLCALRGVVVPFIGY